MQSLSLSCDYIKNKTHQNEKNLVYFSVVILSNYTTF